MIPDALFLLPLETIPGIGDSNLIAPAGGAGLLFYFLYQAAKNYKEGRKIDVAAAEQREQAAELRADKAERDLRGELDGLKRQLSEERKERNLNEAAQEVEIRKLRTKVGQVSRINFELRQLLISKGYGDEVSHIPEDILD